MGKNIFHVTMTAFLWLLSVSVYAQNTIYLNARTIQTTSDFDIKTAIVPTTEDVFNDKFYRLVQFNHLPMPNDKAEMKQNGIEIMGYIPDQAFIMSFPKGFDFSFLSKYDVKTVIILRGADKMSDGLRNSKFPDFAQKIIGKYDLSLQPYANITLEQVAIDLQKRGFEVIGLPSTFFQTVTIRVKKADIERVAALPYVRFIDFIDGQPIREDEKSNQLHRGNMLNTDGKNGLKYDGTSFGISYGDDGPVGPNIDFQGRLIQVQNFSSQGGDIDHADMTAGSAAAAGNLDPALKSGASGATVISQIIDGYPQLQNAEANQFIYKAYITSTSYGQGTPGATEAGCNKYNSSANTVDVQAYTNRRLFHVFSAGNSGGQTCIGVSNYGSITGGYKLGKNVMTVGNLDVSDRLANSSSRGPSVDGRIKPDICAVGTSVYTTLPNNMTTSTTGTSFSCPAVAAVATQLYHAYSDLNNGQIPDAALIKAAILNTADDFGNPGPDFFYGWGRINAWRAYLTLKDTRYMKSSVSRTDSIVKFPLSVPAGVKQVKIMAYWHDPGAEPNTSKALVNDLDLSVKNTETGAVFLPWVLNGTFNADSLSQFARRGKDHVNNVEQVIIDAASLPALGTTQLEVSVNGFSLPNDFQSFYLVYEFNKDDVTVTYPNGGEAVAVGSSEMIRWDAPVANDTEGSFALDFSNDGGVTWQAIAATVPGSVRALRWTVPNQVTGKACVRARYIQTNGTIISDLSDDLFTVSKLATNLTVKYICPDSTYLSFDTVAGAKSYEISRLGAKYMDAIMTTPLNFVAIPQNWMDSAWYSVRPVLPDGGLGRRVNAVSKPRYLTAICPSVKDLQTVRMAQSISGTIYACRDGLDRPLSIWLKNSSTVDIDSFRLGYQINANTAVQTIVRQKIKGTDSLLYVLPQKIPFPSVGNYTLKVWTKIDNDANATNDTLSTDVYVRDRYRAPLTEVFDNKPFPPEGFQIASSSGPTTWTKATNILGTDGSRTTTAIFDGQLYPTRGFRDTLLTWLCDLKGIRNPQLSFDISYQMLSPLRSPNLAVIASTDCGRTFKATSYAKTRFELSNSTTTGILWQPSRTSHWRRDTVNIAAYTDSVVMLGLVFYPDNDNRLYIDNINIEGGLPTATENTPLSIPMLTAFPNPSEDGIFTLALKNFDAQSLTVKVFDATGKVILTKQIGQVMGDRQEVLDLQGQPSGVYLLQTQTEKKTYQLKVTKM
jgi:hypothetical protein